jgi:hypothetical protein
VAEWEVHVVVTDLLYVAAAAAFFASCWALISLCERLELDR